jgi:hypothetical protein
MEYEQMDQEMVYYAEGVDPEAFGAKWIDGDQFSDADMFFIGKEEDEFYDSEDGSLTPLLLPETEDEDEEEFFDCNNTAIPLNLWSKIVHPKDDEFDRVEVYVDCLWVPWSYAWVDKISSMFNN